MFDFVHLILYFISNSIIIIIIIYCIVFYAIAWSINIHTFDYSAHTVYIARKVLH